jgi:uroporphyrin-III C-methyltransferase / precorrin-2 dehydrogenase / sirohydrochlorin ferrochelatase
MLKLQERYSVSVLRPTADIRPGRIRPLARLPVFFALEGRCAVVAGGSAAAAWKAELLSAAGACVTVFAGNVCPELQALTADPPGGTISVCTRVWTPADLSGAALAVGAFAADVEAAAFAQVARAAGVPVNVIDKPVFCDFSFGAIVNRSPLVVGISTDGAAPVFAQAIRSRLEALLPQSFAAWAAAAQRWRATLKTSELSGAARGMFWQLFAKQAITKVDSAPTVADFVDLLAEVKGQGRSIENGSLTLIDAGGGADSLTLRDLRALQSADVIVYDDGVSPDILDFGRREARKISVGERYVPSNAGHDAARLMRDLAAQGRRVVRLKGIAADLTPAAPGSSACRSAAAA